MTFGNMSVLVTWGKHTRFRNNRNVTILFLVT